MAKSKAKHSPVRPQKETGKLHVRLSLNTTFDKVLEVVTGNRTPTKGMVKIS